MEYQSWTVGHVVRRLRKEKNMTIEELSDAVDKSVSHITQLEEGNRRMSIDLLFALMNVFETDANTLLAIPERETIQEVSIDKELDKLEPLMKGYLSNTFLHMISEVPA